MGVPHVRFKSSPAPEGCGGRRRRTTASQGDRSVPRGSACPSASVGGGLGRRRAPRRRRHFLRRTAARAMVENAGGCCNLRIEVRVRRRDALESYWQEMGGRGARTGANRAGSRGGSRRPELRKETSSGLFQWLGRVLVECRGGVGTSWSSGPLFIGGSRGWP